MQHFQYFVEVIRVYPGPSIGVTKATPPQQLITEQLNVRGQEGWELVQALTPRADLCEITMIWKRSTT